MPSDRDTEEVTYETLRELDQNIEELSDNMSWYQNELLDMVGDSDQGAEIWYDYRREMKDTGQKLTKLRRKRSEILNALR